MLCALLLCAIQPAMVEASSPVTITINEPGTLEEVLLDYPESRIDNLVLKGTLNGLDLRHINSPSGVLLTVETLDLSDIYCVEDLEHYYARIYNDMTSTAQTFFYSLKEEKILQTESDWIVSATRKYNVYTNSLAALLSGENAPYKEVIMPQGIYPADYAIMGNKKIHKIVYDKEVDSIGDFAFRDCTALEEIIIPSRELITHIGQGSFRNCAYDDFDNISPTSIGMSAFELSKVTSIDLSNVSSLGENAFSQSTISGRIDISSLATIPGGVFYRCTQLTDVMLSPNLTSIGGGAFQYTNLTNIEFPDNLIYMGKWAFNDTPYWKSVMQTDGYQDGILYIGKFAYSSKPSEVPENVVIKEGTVGLCDDLFWYYYTKSLKSVTLPSSLKTIGKRVFDDCESIEDIVFPDGLLMIDDEAFYRCQNLKSLTFPSSLKYIGNNAFSNCTSLTDLSLESNIEHFVLNAFSGCSGISKLYYNIPEFEYAYEAKNGPFINLKRVNIGPNVRKMPFWGSQLTKIEFEPRNNEQPLEISYTGRYENLKSICFPQTLRNIPDACFHGARQLENVTFVSEIITPDFSIGDQAFENCESLKSFELPTTTVSIGNRAFMESGLESIKLPECLKTIGGGAFVGCLNNQEMLILPASLESFYNQADWFYPSAFSHSGIKGVTIPGNLLGRSDLQFYSCESLDNLVMQDGGSELAISVEDSPFKEFNVPNGIVKITGRFSSESVRNVVIPDDVCEISSSLKFKNMQSISLPITCLNIAGWIDGSMNYNLSWRIPDVYEYDGEATENVIYRLGNVGGTLDIPEGISVFGFDQDNRSVATTAGRLTDITLPSTLKSINCQAFYGSYYVNIKCFAKNPPSLSGIYDIFVSEVNNNGLQGKLYVPQESISKYQKHTAWKRFEIYPLLDDSGIDEVDISETEDIQCYYSMDGTKLSIAPTHSGVYIAVTTTGKIFKIYVK